MRNLSLKEFIKKKTTKKYLLQAQVSPSKIY